MYDRLAYTESLVNLCGVAIVLTSLCGIRETRKAPGSKLCRRRWRSASGSITKQTVILFAFFPALAGIWLARKQPRRLLASLGLIYGAGLCFLALDWLMKPEAPTLRNL